MLMAKVFNEVKVADDAVVPKEGDAEAYKIGDVKIEIAAIQANLLRVRPMRIMR